MGDQACVSEAALAPALEKGPKMSGQEGAWKTGLICFGIGLLLDLKLGEAWATLGVLPGTCSVSPSICWVKKNEPLL